MMGKRVGSFNAKVLLRIFRAHPVPNSAELFLDHRGKNLKQRPSNEQIKSQHPRIVLWSYPPYLDCPEPVHWFAWGGLAG